MQNGSNHLVSDARTTMEHGKTVLHRELQLLQASAFRCVSKQLFHGLNELE